MLIARVGLIDTLAGRHTAEPGAVVWTLVTDTVE